MDWFKDNSVAIQAIASLTNVVIALILAAVTVWYVRLTREIAKSSADQVKQMRETANLQKEAEERLNRQLALTLFVLAQRSRVGLGAVSFTHAALRAYTQPTEADVTELEQVARQLNNARILSFASKAVTGLRSVLAIVQRAKSVRPEVGWVPGPQEQAYWNEAVKASVENLQELEAQCGKILRPDTSV